MGKILFHEEQRYNQWWLWLILIITLLSVVIPFSYGIYSQVVLGKPFGDKPTSTEGLIVTGIFTALLMLFILFIVAKMRLKTKITADGIFYCYPPLIRKWKRISPVEIETYEIRTFRAIHEFNGYGIKKRRKYGTAYIIAGNTGLQIYLKNGKKILIGTQKKQAIGYAMGKMMEQESR